jgi:D-alanyl-D-alanine carboxypeptidase
MLKLLKILFIPLVAMFTTYTSFIDSAEAKPRGKPAAGSKAPQKVLAGSFAALTDSQGNFTTTGIGWNIDKQMDSASIIKLLTLLAAQELMQERGLTLNSKIKTKKVFPIGIGQSGVPIPIGLSITYRELLTVIMIKSANNATRVLEEEFGKTELIGKMNQIASSFGATNTNATNSAGLRHPQHKTTARDFAAITAKVGVNLTSEFKAIASGVKGVWRGQAIGRTTRVDGYFKEGNVGPRKSGSLKNSSSFTASFTYNGKTCVATTLGEKTAAAAVKKTTDLCRQEFNIPAPSIKLNSKATVPTR